MKERETKHMRKHSETKVHKLDARQRTPNFLIWKVAQMATLRHARARLHFQHPQCNLLTCLDKVVGVIYFLLHEIQICLVNKNSFLPQYA